MLLENYLHVHTVPFNLVESHFICPSTVSTIDWEYYLFKNHSDLPHSVSRVEVKRMPLACLILPPFSHPWESQLNPLRTFTEYFLWTRNKAEEQWEVGMSLTNLESENDI